MSDYRDLYIEALNKITDLKIENVCLRGQRFTLFSHLRLAAGLTHQTYPLQSEGFLTLITDLEKQLETFVAECRSETETDQAPEHGSARSASGTQTETPARVPEDFSGHYMDLPREVRVQFWDRPTPKAGDLV